MSNQIAKSSKDFFAMPNVKAKLAELLGKNAAPDNEERVKIEKLVKEWV